MSYFLTENQIQIRDVAAKFARNEVEPLANQIDHDESLPPALTKKVAELGLFGLCIPEQYGGIGADISTACLVLEEIAKASPSFAGLLSVQIILCPLMVLHLGTEEQKQRLLPPSATGERLMALSGTEPAGAGNSAAHLTRLTEDGQAWRLNGAKLFCTQGEAKTYLVMGKIKRNGKDERCCVIAEQEADGFSVAPYEDKLGWRGTNTGSVSFTDVLITSDNILSGHAHVLANLASFLGHAATSFGCALGMFEKTLAYVKERELYGVPMYQLSPLSHWLAEVYCKLQAMRSLLYTSARLYDEGRFEVPMGFVCKASICNTAFECTNTLLQMWGGSGMMNSTGINRYFRDARTKMIAEGATEMHTAIIAQAVLGLRLTTGGMPFAEAV